MEEKSELSGDYIAGFIDGEGCFSLNFRRDVRNERKNKPVYFQWKARFEICLKIDDINLLKKIKNSLGCGNIYKIKKGKYKDEQVLYAVVKIEDLNDKIVPFFRKHKLHGKKKEDFNLWSEAVEIILKYKRRSINAKKGKRGFIKTIWSKKDFDRLIEIQELMQAYKAKRPQGHKWILEAKSIVGMLD